MRLARAFDEGRRDGDQRAFARLANAVTKFWMSKRAPDFVFEAMECHGGNGYVEESILPRLYREAPVSSIWEGCGNVIALDILRAIRRDPDSLDAYFAELAPAGGADRRLDRAIAELRDLAGRPAELEPRGRRLAERLALTLQGALLVRHGDPRMAEAFCRSRLEGDRGATYGTLPADLPFRGMIERARPQVP
jgi:putative acyl-CoA dehydrogenase